MISMGSLFGDFGRTLVNGLCWHSLDNCKENTWFMFLAIQLFYCRKDRVAICYGNCLKQSSQFKYLEESQFLPERQNNAISLQLLKLNIPTWTFQHSRDIECRIPQRNIHLVMTMKVWLWMAFLRIDWMTHNQFLTIIIPGRLLIIVSEWWELRCFGLELSDQLNEFISNECHGLNESIEIG